MLCDVQTELDAAAEAGELTDGAYIRICDKLKKAHEAKEIDVLEVKKDAFAEAVMSNVCNIFTGTESVKPLDQTVIRKIFWLADKSAADREWFCGALQAYAEVILEGPEDPEDSVDLDDAPDDIDLMSAFRDVVESCHSNHHKLFSRIIAKKHGCFLCRFGDVRRKCLRKFAVDVVANAPLMVVNIMNCDHCKVKLPRLVHIARDCAVDSDWEDPEFVGLVGKRKRARSER